ncbi:hypothetical protein ACTYWN_004716 [Escherichia coli]|uniref:hypothetical protein n=1 Tax=Escherichia coli TaxID=562 RepID=UPI0018430484|nr:hypothetical protein [Escherichia coli]EFD9099999.1 hypothetical protein [Escherichia coli]EFN2469776.1 hypothetical protein [Escherichia coli]EGT7915914.1 hypothetical protein [Escherichia coli]EIU8039573.1 hypothetical protein [Escherichia coli]EIW6265475.1 hypothetical protein [Escherichia coli]
MNARIGESYYDRLGGQPEYNQTAAERRKFHDAVDAAAEEIINTELSQWVGPVIDKYAESLFEILPEEMRHPVSPLDTEYKMETVRRLLAGRLGHKLGRGLTAFN